MKKLKRKDQAAGPNTWVKGRHNLAPRDNSPRHDKKIERAKLKTKKATPKNNVFWLLIFVVIVIWMPIIQLDCLPQTAGQCSHTDIYRDIIREIAPPAKRFAPFINQALIKERLEATNKLQSVEIYRTWYNTLRINIIERSAIALWRADKSNDLYILDRQGVVIEPFTVGAKPELPLIIDTLDVTANVGEPLVESTAIAAASQIYQGDYVEGYTLKYLKIDSAPRQFSAVFESTSDNSTLTVRFTSVRPLEEQLVDLNLTLGYLDEKGRAVSYIDVRLQSSTIYR